MEKPDSIKEVKSKKSSITIKEVVKDQIKFEFTCPKCGSNSFQLVVASNHKFGGAGMSAEKLKVCRNCNYSE